jgi:trigger factor
MQVSVQSGEGLERRMTVELPADEINQEVEKRLKKIARTVRMDGFRPGKVPMKILRTRYGLQVQQEVFGELIQSSYPGAVDQEKLRPAGAPKIEPLLDQSQGNARFAYTAVFDVLPEIELASLSEQSIKRPAAEVVDADVDEMIERLRRQRQTWEEVERGAQDGDQVHISFKGTIDGEPFEGGEASDVPVVLGSGMMVEGFEAGLVDASAGDKRSLELQFPDNYQVEKVAGKPVMFEVEVSKVAEPVLPELNEELAKSFGVESGDIGRFRDDIRGNMERELTQRIESKLKNQAMDTLLEAHKIEVPAALVEEEIDALRQQARQGTPAAGNMELPRNLFEEQAKRRVALGLIIAEVVKKNDLKVDPERVKSTIEEMAASYEDPQEVVNFYNSNQQQRASVESLVLENQVVEWVLEQARVEEEPSSFKEVTEDPAKALWGPAGKRART